MNRAALAVAVALQFPAFSQNTSFNDSLGRLIRGTSHPADFAVMREAETKLAAGAFQQYFCCRTGPLAPLRMGRLTELLRGEREDPEKMLGGFVPQFGSVLASDSDFQFALVRLGAVGQRLGVRPYFESSQGFGPHIEWSRNRVNVRCVLLWGTNYQTILFALGYAWP